MISPSQARIARPAGHQLAPVSEKAIAALFEYTPQSGAELDRTPLLAIFGDGTIVVRRTENERHEPTLPTYWTGQLRIEQAIELNILETAVLRDPELKEHYDIPSDYRQPITTFVFSDDDKVLAVQAAGLFAGEYDLDAETRPGERLPATLLAYHRFLVELLFDLGPLSPWHPDHYVARLIQVGRSSRIVAWPSWWPSINSAQYHLSSRYLELVAPVSSREEFWSAIPGGRSGCVVELAGKYWEVECFPYYRGHGSWYAKIAGAEDWTLEWNSICLCEQAPLSYPKRASRGKFRFPFDPNRGVPRFGAPILPAAFNGFPEISLPRRSTRVRT